ncbi:MAG: [protein-PII] uridylyltransferase [Betaproteobacteria bacterium]|nr:[protein-PII] uridylyltransferase [Betaproteobacteria bacterium]
MFPGVRELVPRLRPRLQEGRERLRQAFDAHPVPTTLVHGRSGLVDQILREVWSHFQFPANLAFAAVGGYGRGELYPASDVDVLVLLPDGIDAATEEKLSQMVGVLWDLGLDVGHSMRSVGQCVEEAARDISVQTNLLEARQLAGSRGLFEYFTNTIREHTDKQAFFKAKRLEQEERYLRYQETAYSLEPNCKESPGGLRDLQVILWISRAAGFGESWNDVVRSGLVTRQEAHQLAAVESMLQLIRIRLHHLSGRREDRLLFDHQEALAEQFGVKRTATRRASEVFMQRYYRNAKLVTQLNTIVLQNLGASIFPAPKRAQIHINERFQMVRELLDARSETVFEDHPAAILESFLILQEHAELKGMTARTLRALWRARRLLTPDFRRNPDNRALFVKIFQQERGLVHELRRMNQYGILGAYLPTFGRIVGQMQHDLFHVYTVDQHILQVVRNLRRFAMEEHAHEYPLCSRLITGFERSWLLYVAALFHDIAKGRGGDHSQLGRRDARVFCRLHGVSEEDTELVEFLVGHHLTMSAVAQKQDLGDPEVVKGFAGIVGSERRLTALYLLTHADIRGTSPKVWNAWKSKLLEDLFHGTMHLLRGATPRQAVGLSVRQVEARRLLSLHGLRANVEKDFWRELDTVYFMRHDTDEIAWHTRNLYHRPTGELPVVKARFNPIGEGLQVMVYTRDVHDLFARLCGFFARLGYSIVDAKIHTTRHGFALDSFVLLDPLNQFNTREMISVIEHELEGRLQHMGPPDQPKSVRLSRQVRHFPITPEVHIQPDERGHYYIMTVTAADRPGLLFSIARVMAEHRIDLHTAKIATLGERVEDTFLISGSELSRKSTLIRLETDLLEALQI